MNLDNIQLSITPVTWEQADTTPLQFDVARLDLLHPVVSGNKWFKLRYNLQQAVEQGYRGIVTAGGAYSNHLAATAYACRQMHLEAVALVRGEIIQPLNHTLSFCQLQHMQLHAMPRPVYADEQQLQAFATAHYKNFLFVPEGGSNVAGEQGCARIVNAIPAFNRYTHIICAAGTGTTCRGLAAAAAPHQTIIAIPALKIPEAEQAQYCQRHLQTDAAQAAVIAHFGYAGKGYARHDNTLLQLMNDVYRQTGIALDFVYTAKAWQATVSLLQLGTIPPNAKVLLLHTGGLQGNQSLPTGTLLY